jgi:signal transduction histidine kinase
MDGTQLESLFKLVHGPTTPGTADEKGTGLGLILCREFIDMHGGQIWAESEPGKGSVFSFSLPMKPLTEES